MVVLWIREGVRGGGVGYVHGCFSNSLSNCIITILANSKMPANHDPTLSILLCCLPFLLLLLLAPHLRLGPFRLNGILYHFHLPFHPQHPKPAR